MRILDMLIILGIMIIAGIITVDVFSFGEGLPHDSLLDFPCQELEHSKISTDGPDGRFVTDFMSWNGGWVPQEIIKQASITKGCINETKKDIFKYTTYK